MCASDSLNRRRPNGLALRSPEDCESGLCLSALANPHRFALVVKLCDEEASVSELVEWIGLAQPTVSHHLAVLREASLVKVRHVAQQHLYSADLDWISQCCGRLFRQLHVQPGPGVATRTGWSGQRLDNPFFLERKVT